MGVHLHILEENVMGFYINKKNSFVIVYHRSDMPILCKEFALQTTYYIEAFEVYGLFSAVPWFHVGYLSLE